MAIPAIGVADLRDVLVGADLPVPDAEKSIQTRLVLHYAQVLRDRSVLYDHDHSGCRRRFSGESGDNVIVYEVNLEVDHAIFAAYRTWLNEHVRGMLALPGFVAAEIFELRDAPSATQRHGLCVQYRLADAADLDRYLRVDAPRMRRD